MYVVNVNVVRINVKYHVKSLRFINLQHIQNHIKNQDIVHLNIQKFNLFQKN